MAFSERIEATTLDHLNKIVDTVLSSNVLAREVLLKATTFRGKKHLVPVRISKNDTGGSFSGMDVLTRSSTDTTKNMEFESKNYHIDITLPGTEIDLNSTEQGINDLVKFKMEEAALDAAEDIGEIFYGDGTGNSGKDFLGLEAIVDDGTNAATIGGLSRATYPTLKATVTASGGTLTLAMMTTLYNTISDGSIQPNFIVTTKAVHALVEKLMQTINTHTALPAGASSYSAGATSLVWKGIPVLSDAKCPTGIMYMLNMNFLNFASLQSKPIGDNKMMKANWTINNIDGTPNKSVAGLGFSFQDFRMSQNQYGYSGSLFLFGEFIPKAPNRNGKLTGITTA